LYDRAADPLLTLGGAADEPAVYLDLMTGPQQRAHIEVPGPEDYPALRVLLREYREWVGADPCFPTFEQELASLPGEYAPPGGALLVARGEGELLGCIALRGIPAVERGLCEMKRLYVRPHARGTNLGRRLVQALLEVARERGHAAMRLDTLPHMKSAIAIYTSFGFRGIERYGDNPDPRSLFFECDLREPTPPQERMQ
jgi:GNAT superfamily N-acetyltransferase